MEDERRSGLGCLWLIGWTFLTLWLAAVALSDYEDPAYNLRAYDLSAPAPPWWLTQAELILFGCWLLVWLAGIGAWHGLRSVHHWLSRHRHASTR